MLIVPFVVRVVCQLDIDPVQLWRIVGTSSSATGSSGTLLQVPGFDLPDDWSGEVELGFRGKLDSGYSLVVKLGEIKPSTLESTVANFKAELFVLPSSGFNDCTECCRGKKNSADGETHGDDDGVRNELKVVREKRRRSGC